MFKYKSPLSRLLEGAGKAKEDTGAEIEETQEETPEPIADFNALRAALSGSNLNLESFEDTDELIPEEEMPDFTDEEVAVSEPVLSGPFVDEGPVEDAAPDVVEEEEQIVALRLQPEDAADEDSNILSDVYDAVTPAPEDEPEAVIEVDVIAEPEPETREPVAETTEPAEVTPEPVAVTPEPFEVLPEPVAVAPDPMPEPEPEPEVVAPAPTPAADRSARVKTTFLGFERADTHVQDLIETSEPAAKTEAAQQTFPVGWLVVTAGPGRGACITLSEGLMQIGRNDDQSIQLDFGDTGISRSNHAVIAYDPEDRKCYLGHGGKANLVRLNGKPVLSTVPLSSGDLIRISETSIRFVAFCDDSFDWRDAD